MDTATHRKEKHINIDKKIMSMEVDRYTAKEGRRRHG